MRFRFLDILLFALLFIFVKSFPVDLFELTAMQKELIKLGLRILLLTYYIYILWKNRINIFKFANYKRALYFIPFLLACFSNLIAMGVAQSTVLPSFYPWDFILVFTINLVLSAILEEFLFRFIIQNSLIAASSIVRILASAGIFALFHLLNLIDVSSVDQLVAVLIQVAYTFGLGILLGFIYEYTYSLPLCMAFHILFNIMNSAFISVYNTIVIPDIYGLVTALIIAAILIAYTSLIYLFVLRKFSKYFRE